MQRRHFIAFIGLTIIVTSYALAGSFGHRIKTPVPIPLTQPRVSENGFTCGNIDGDSLGKINLADIEFFIDYLYFEGVAPDPLGNADIDSIPGVSANDLQMLLNYFFWAGEAPYCGPFPDSVLPTADSFVLYPLDVPPLTTTISVGLIQATESFPNYEAMTFSFYYACSTSIIECDSVTFDIEYDHYELKYFSIDSCQNKLLISLLNAGEVIPEFTGNVSLAHAWFTLTSSVDTQSILMDTCNFAPDISSILTSNDTNFLPNQSNDMTIAYRPDMSNTTSIDSMPCCREIRGNIDSDNCDATNISDLIFLVDYMFKSGPAPNCMKEADMNGSGGSSNVSDLTYLIDFMFRGGTAPVACWEGQ